MSNDNVQSTFPNLRPVQRMRITQRVLAQLADIAPDTYVEADSETNPLEPVSHRVVSDLLLVSVSVRIRIALLSHDWLTGTASLVPDAHELMAYYPDTDAVALVIGDDQLTTLIIEPFDRFDAIRVPEGTVVSNISMSGGPGPIRDVVQEYLKDTMPQWESVDALTIANNEQGALDFARIAATDAIREAAAKNYRLIQKQKARDSLSDADRDFVIDLALGALQGRISIEQAIRAREEQI